MGVGVGWMREEFDALGVPFEARGRMTDEQLEVVAKLWSQDHASHQGEFYRFDDLAFHPRPMQGRLPIWVGGEGRPARRRAGRYGDAWFPYFIDTTAEELAAGMEEVRRFAVEAGRDPGAVSLTACRAIEITPEPVTQDPRHLRGTPEQLSEALEAYRAAGVEHLALQFMVPRWPERKEQIERFASEAMPAPR
jgi:alkanesulfonate monooxygenase SsuD/methylene tetrahydromethanopterin reductase-like flavin-dependent oxidoreductase (luciferase family)